MTEDIQKYSLFIKNSKIFLGRILKRDSKTRNVELELNNQKKTICKIKDLILEVSLANSPVTNNNDILKKKLNDILGQESNYKASSTKRQVEEQQFLSSSGSSIIIQALYI